MTTIITVPFTNACTVKPVYDGTGIYIAVTLYIIVIACPRQLPKIFSCVIYSAKLTCIQGFSQKGVQPFYGRPFWTPIHLISYNLMGKHAFWKASFQCLAKSLPVYNGHLAISLGWPLYTVLTVLGTPTKRSPMDQKTLAVYISTALGCITGPGSNSMTYQGL